MDGEDVKKSGCGDSDKAEADKVPESPKPLAFTIDFGDGRSFDTERHRTLVEKYQRKHRRGQSLSKLDDASSTTTTTNSTSPLINPKKRHPLTGNLPRKSSFQSEGYFSSDEKSERLTKSNVRTNAKRHELTLPLKSVIFDKLMTQSVPSDAFLATSPPIDAPEKPITPSTPPSGRPPLGRQHSTPEVKAADVGSTSPLLDDEHFVDGLDYDFDQSDTVSDAGTYILDADNYSEEQKARMSIDAEYKIEQVSVLKKAEDYVKSLSLYESKKLSPILSPTQNISITDNNDLDKTFTKIMFPSPKPRREGGGTADRGNVISVTSSGAFRSKADKERMNARKLSLTKSEVHVEAYVGDRLDVTRITNSQLSANLISVQSIPTREDDSENPLFNRLNNLNSPSKIPSPVHSGGSRPRSRNSIASLNVDLSDSSLETESYLKPTQNYIDTLQQRLEVDNDHELNDRNRLNNTSKTAHMRHNSLDGRNVKIYNKLQNKTVIDQTLFDQYSSRRLDNSPNTSPIRRSSSFSNRQPIKNTNLKKETNLLKNFRLPIQKSSSTANMQSKKIDRLQYAAADTDTTSSEEDFDKNAQRKEVTTSTTTTTASTTTTGIAALARNNRAFALRRARAEGDNDAGRLKCPNTPEMRRKFQRASLDSAGYGGIKERATSVDRRPTKTNDVQSRYLLNVCKSNKTTATTNKNEFNGCGAGNNNVSSTNAGAKKANNAVSKSQSNKTTFARTDTGRYSMRAVSTTKPPPAGGTIKLHNNRKDGKKSGGRSNSSLSSREVEFQNWKRRKSYDPMKAAAEGKKKEMIAKRQTKIQTTFQDANNQDCDSSPSHSSSVHRSQSFHGTAALEQLISSDEDDEDPTLSADEGFSPPTPSPCTLSPIRVGIKYPWRERVLH